MMYETYELSRKEWGIYGAEGILGIAVMDYVFYRNAGLFLVLLPVGMLFPLMLRKQLKKRRLETCLLYTSFHKGSIWKKYWEFFTFLRKEMIL